MLEFPRTLFIFFAANHFLDIPIVVAFLVSTSVLYFVPKFRGAGGLLAVYCVLFYPLLGGTPFEGLLFSILFRVSGVLFFAFPIYFYNKVIQGI